MGHVFHPLRTKTSRHQYRHSQSSVSRRPKADHRTEFTTTNEHDQVGLLSRRKFTTRFMWREQNCRSNIFISAKLLLMCLAGICRIFQAI